MELVKDLNLNQVIKIKIDTTKPLTVFPTYIQRAKSVITNP
jgi:hypothetical protein